MFFDFKPFMSVRGTGSRPRLVKKARIYKEHHDRISRQSLYEDGIPEKTKQFFWGFNSFHQEKSALYRHLAYMLHMHYFLTKGLP